MIIDEKKEHVLRRVTKTKKGNVIKESDHNTIVTKLTLPWNKKKEKKSNEEFFNLKNGEGQKKFKEVTSNNNHLSKVFEDNNDLNEATNQFLKRLNKTIFKCFKKIKPRKEKPVEEQERKYNRWKQIKNKTDDASKAEAQLLEDDLADDYFKKIKNAAEGIDCEVGGNISNELWKLKKQLYPQHRDPPTAMLDPEGNLVKSQDQIKNLAVKAYEKRLENRPMASDLKEMQKDKEKLAEKLMEVAKKNKTPDWSSRDLHKVLEQLKMNKSRDPHGLANELFKNEVAGNDLKRALLLLMNRIKSEQIFPKALEFCNISSIWKQKGPRNDFESYRGIFRVTIFRNILDRLIYNDEYQNIDAKLSDCNVGGRKGRNIRDNIFALNAIMNARKKQNGEALDVQIFDVEKCFDALWLHEVITCLFNVGLQNDKLPLLFQENKNAQVAVKTPGGISSRVSIKEIIMQGSVWGSLCCVVLMDKLGKLVYSKPELLYYYKGLVEVPTLQMVDDILCIQKCSPQSVQQNSVVNTFMELEKLTLNQRKCHKIHIGNQSNLCQELKIHGQQMKEAKSDTYLGDKVHYSGNNKANIEARVAKGYGKVKTILAMLKEAPLGKARIQSGLILREAMLINGILFNSEAWHGITTSDVASLERVDEALLRGVVGGHSKLPITALYLECGAVPLRYIIMSRRIMYLQVILKREETEQIKKLYKAQKESKTKGDFADFVEQDMHKLEVKETEEEIKNMTKSALKKIIKEKVKVAALKYLTKNKTSKTEKLTHKKLEMQQYLRNPIFGEDESRLLLALRTRTVRGIRTDFPGMFPSRECPLLGCREEDTLPHLLTCTVLLSQVVGEEHSTSRFADIYSENLEQELTITKKFARLLETRVEREGLPATRIAGSPAPVDTAVCNVLHYV